MTEPKPTPFRESGYYSKFSQYRLGVGPRCPWYFEPRAPLPYGWSAAVVIIMKLTWPDRKSVV